MKQPEARTIIIGAGPAGLMSAIHAAESGQSVLVLERMAKPGLKLLTTGGGRCNLTNILSADKLMERFGRFGRFMEPSLRSMDNHKLLEFFSALGVKAHCQDGFHYFPVAESAEVVLSALLNRCAQLGVQFRYNCRVTGLIIKDEVTLGAETDSGPISADRIILAAGGKSYAGLGADGSGFDIAAKAGHTVKPQYPALVSLVAQETWIADCSGTAFADAEVWIDLPKWRGTRKRGAVLFTHRGLSGPAVLDLSGDVAQLLDKMPTVPIRLRWQLKESAAEWTTRIDYWRRAHGSKLIKNLLDEGLPASFATALAASCCTVETKAAHLTAEQASLLIQYLTELPLQITSTEGFGKAMVTRGGVSLKEIDPATLQSRKVKGLYFAGEIVDLDGPCGGYNLQWAFSSGWLAGGAPEH